eukprot:g13410.t1
MAGSFGDLEAFSRAIQGTYHELRTVHKSNFLLPVVEKVREMIAKFVKPFRQWFGRDPGVVGTQLQFGRKQSTPELEAWAEEILAELRKKDDDDMEGLLDTFRPSVHDAAGETRPMNVVFRLVPEMEARNGLKLSAPELRARATPNSNTQTFRVELQLVHGQDSARARLWFTIVGDRMADGQKWSNSHPLSLNRLEIVGRQQEEGDGINSFTKKLLTLDFVSMT